MSGRVVSEQAVSEQGDALVVGEALVDVVRRQGEVVGEHPGGSPANVALGLARLGRPTRLLTRLVDDDHGRHVADHLRRSGVVLETDLLPASAGRTSTAQADIGPDGGAQYVFDLEWALPADAADRAGHPRVVCTGSLATALPPGADDVRALLAHVRTSATVVYDPNLRPTIIGSADAVRADVEALVATADVVKMSAEDAEWLHPGRDAAGTARAWLALGPALVVLTRGAEGSLGLCADGEVAEERLVVEVADTVGAGDSFTGGLVDALWRADLLGGDRREDLRRVSREQVRQALVAATRVAAITVSRPGADPPTRAELDASSR